MQFNPSFRDDWADAQTWGQALAPLRLPSPGQHGAITIHQEFATHLPVFGALRSFLAEQRWTRLYDGEQLWMSDTPQERAMMLHGARGMAGHVLVAGGGLGIYPQFLLRYGRATRITIVEQHPTIAHLLRRQFAHKGAVQIVEAPFEHFIFHPAHPRYDGCYIDIHPTIDPTWLPGLNWLRDQCSALIRGELRIWGYHWLCRLLVVGIAEHYLPLLRQGRAYDTPLGRHLQAALPSRWLAWSAEQITAWLLAYSQRVAWPVEGTVRFSSAARAA